MKIMKIINRIDEITVEPSYRDHLYSLLTNKSTEVHPKSTSFPTLLSGALTAMLEGKAGPP